MTTLYMRRVGNALHPDGAEMIAAFQKVPFNTPLKVEAKKQRNIRFNALYWTLCTRIANGVGSEPENISDLLKIATGHFTLIRSKSYGDLKLPKSISFAKMENSDFSAFFEKCCAVIYSEWGVDPASVADLLVPEEAHVR